MTDTKRPGPYDIGEEEWEAMSAQRQREYETGEMLDRELGLAEPEVGNDTMATAAAVLKRRGIVLADATQEQLLSALKVVSS
jgi:hypothetical protein